MKQDVERNFESEEGAALYSSKCTLVFPFLPVFVVMSASDVWFEVSDALPLCGHLLLATLGAIWFSLLPRGPTSPVRLSRRLISRTREPWSPLPS